MLIQGQKYYFPTYCTLSDLDCTNEDGEGCNLPSPLPPHFFREKSIYKKYFSHYIHTSEDKLRLSSLTQLHFCSIKISPSQSFSFSDKKDFQASPSWLMSCSTSEEQARVIFMPVTPGEKQAVIMITYLRNCLHGIGLCGHRMIFLLISSTGSCLWYKLQSLL